jgi:hypothetical protein
MDYNIQLSSDDDCNLNSNNDDKTKDRDASESKKKRKISDELKGRFEQLKERRSKLSYKVQKKEEKKKLNKPNKQPEFNFDSNLVDKCVNDSVERACDKNDLSYSANQVENRIKNKNKIIDEALKNGEFSLAEKVSDELVNDEDRLKTIKLEETRRYEKQLLKKKSSKKIPLNWNFNAKQRWETKSNM